MTRNALPSNVPSKLKKLISLRALKDSLSGITKPTDHMKPE
jgi:hypothetical protein